MASRCSGGYDQDGIIGSLKQELRFEELETPLAASNLSLETIHEESANGQFQCRRHYRRWSIAERFDREMGQRGLEQIFPARHYLGNRRVDSLFVMHTKIWRCCSPLNTKERHACSQWDLG